VCSFAGRVGAFGAVPAWAPPGSSSGHRLQVVLPQPLAVIEQDELRPGLVADGDLLPGEGASLPGAPELLHRLAGECEVGPGGLALYGEPAHHAAGVIDFVMGDVGAKALSRFPPCERGNAF